uniref:RRM domain-containing protein n=1 Tax=Brassica campestris TaxID=3711 RepID=A0A3P6ABE3_BRACM|nr:unnamed protein product [Brassica rapa]
MLFDCEIIRLCLLESLDSLACNHQKHIENIRTSMAMTNGDVSRTLNPAAPLFFPQNPYLHHYYFSSPQILFISDTNLPPLSSIIVYYPLWYNNPNPTWFEATQELPPLHSQDPIQELTPPPTSRKKVFGWERSSRHDRNKLVWRRKIHYQAESNGDTTVMLRNIPNKYTREMLIQFLDEHCEEENNKEEDEENAYDFLYLPIDFHRSQMNKGYAFVNFTKAEAVSKFKAACNNKPWCCFGSRKILEIAHARIQVNKLVKHFEQMIYPAEAYSAVTFIPARRGPKSTGLTIMVGKCTEAAISV